jgi:Histidinol-phosphate/aromatic aminotransferase and cobyric acid decarboxylase
MLANTEDKLFDIELFDKTTHNPSFASLTNNFKNDSGLKDYCIPVNSYFPPDHIMQELFERLPYALKYYPSSNESIADNIALFSGVENPDWIVAGNGSTEIISWLNSIFIKESIFVPVPSFGRWIEEPLGLGVEVKTMPHSDANLQSISAKDYVDAVLKSNANNAVICNPNNPTGTLFSREDILWILGELTHLDNIIIDESFIDFSSENPPSVKNDVANFNNTWVLKSLGKNLGLHGVRMGYAISCEANIARMKKHLPYWNVNGITEMLLSLIKNEQVAYDESRLKTINDAIYLSECVEEIRELTVFPTHSNFIFVKLADEFDGEDLRNRMLQDHACLIRNCGNKLGSSKQYFRIAARPVDDIHYLVAALKDVLAKMRAEA